MGGALVCRKLASLTIAAMVVGLLTTASFGQLSGVYRFDGGGDGTSWDDANNWEQVTDPFGGPISGNPPNPPDAVTSAHIPLPGVVIDITMPGQTALDVLIGTADGAGSLNMTGGDLTVRDFNVGADGPGTNAGSFDISGGTLTAGDDVTVGAGSPGTMNMTGGSVDVTDDFFIATDGTMTMSGGTITTGDRPTLTGNGSLVISGGEILAEDDFFFFDNSTVTMEGGLMATIDKISLGLAMSVGPARLIINDGIMRGNEWTDDPELEVDDPSRFMNAIEINGNGKLQIEQATFPVSEARGLIMGGEHLTTTEPGGQLRIQTVVVPEFFGRTDVVFTQISLVPEPASVVLLAIACIAVVCWRGGRLPAAAA
jgi:hypothetical protein